MIVLIFFSSFLSFCQTMTKTTTTTTTTSTTDWIPLSEMKTKKPDFSQTFILLQSTGQRLPHLHRRQRRRSCCQRLSLTLFPIPTTHPHQLPVPPLRKEAISSIVHLLHLLRRPCSDQSRYSLRFFKLLLFLGPFLFFLHHLLLLLNPHVAPFPPILSRLLRQIP